MSNKNNNVIQPLSLRTHMNILLSTLKPVELERRPQDVIDREVIDQFLQKFNLEFFVSLFYKTADYNAFPFKSAINIVSEMSCNLLHEKWLEVFGNVVVFHSYQVGAHSISMELLVYPTEDMIWKKQSIQLSIENELVSAMNCVLHYGHIFQNFDPKKKCTNITKSLNYHQFMDSRIADSMKILGSYIQSYFNFFFNILASFNVFFKSSVIHGVLITNFAIKVKKNDITNSYDFEFLKVSYTLA